jgi:hypothetical protein
MLTVTQESDLIEVVSRSLGVKLTGRREDFRRRIVIDKCCIDIAISAQHLRGTCRRVL